MQIYPLKFRPIYKPRIWGGQKLRTFFNKDIPANEKIGESWELADLPDDKSIIANGEFAGQPLYSIIKKYPEQITGQKNFPDQFPLLIKLLDAQDILSVQVHPDDKTCQRTGKGVPKTECWYIISAESNAVIYRGLKKGVTKPQFAEAIKNGNVADLLEKITVTQGQCYFLPAGTPHAIGAGLLIAEIQTPSDTTYRVFDWNRTDESGKSRLLHIDEALESINFEKQQNLPPKTTGRLADCKFFKIDKTITPKGTSVPITPGKMKTLIILSGSGTIHTDGSDTVEFNPGDTILIPAVCKGLIIFANKAEYLTVTL